MKNRAQPRFSVAPSVSVARRVLRCAAFLSVALALSIPVGAATIYTNEGDFISAIQSFPFFLNEFTNFDYLGQLAHPISACGTGICYQIYSQPPIHLVAFDGTVSTVKSNDQIVVAVGSGSVRALGGKFFLADTNGIPANGEVTLGLSDGTTNSLSSQSNTAPSFLGFISTGPLLTNLVIRFSAGNSQPAMSHFYAGIGVPTLLSSLTATNAIQISWPGPGTGYVLESCPDLVGSCWTNVVQQPQPDGDWIRVFVPNSGTQAFFRLQKQ